MALDPRQFAGLLPDKERQKFINAQGLDMGDGRVFKRGVIVSAADSMRSQADQMRNSLLDQQTLAYRAPLEALQREQQRMQANAPQNPGAFLSPGAPAQTGSLTSAVSAASAPAPGVQSPAGVDPVMMARAFLTQQYQQANPAPAVPPSVPNTGISVAAGPNISTAPTGLPQGSVGYQNAQGQFVVQAPQGPGMGTSTFPNQAAAVNAFAGQPQMQAAPTGPVNAPAFLSQPQQVPAAPSTPAAAPTLANKTYSPQELAQMTPTQLLSRAAYDQQNAAAAAADTESKAKLAKINAETEALQNKPEKTPDAFAVAYNAFNQANPKATPEQVSKFVEDFRKSGAQSTNIDIAGNAFDKEAAKYGAERMGKVYELANNLPQQYEKLLEAQSVVNTQDINTGILADFRQQFDRLKGTALGDKIAQNRASKTEYLEALLGSDVFSQIQALGIGARGLDTVAERQFIQKSITGDKSMTKDTIKQMIELRQKVLKNIMEDYNKAVDRGDYDRFFEKSGLPKRKIEISDKAPPAASPRATNPQTGEIVEFQDGKWVPVK